MYSADKFSSCNVPENGKCAVKIPSCVNYALAILIELVFFVAWSQLLLNCWEGRDREESSPQSIAPHPATCGHENCLGIMLSSQLLEYRLDGVIPDVVFTLQPHFSCSYLPLICLSTNQNIQLIHSLLIRTEWTTENGILVSSSLWSIYNKFYPA